MLLKQGQMETGMFSKYFRSKHILFVLTTALLTQAPMAFAQKKKSASPSSAAAVKQVAPTANEPAPPNEEKLDVSDLERKYWAAKDTDFSVVQNRLFSKAGRYALTAGYGNLLNDPWSDGPTFSVNASHYLSERYGIELAYSNTMSKHNQAAERLVSQGGMPDHNKMKQFYGAAFNWVPFYAKMSVLNSRIVYFDMSLSPGLGVVEYEQQLNTGNVLKTAPAVTLDLTQHFFLSEQFALRLDYKNRWYQEEVVTYRPQTGGARNSSTEWANKSLLMFGVTFYY